MANAAGCTMVLARFAAIAAMATVARGEPKCGETSEVDAPGPGIGADAVTGALVLEGGAGATEDVLVCSPGVSIGSKFRVPLV